MPLRSLFESATLKPLLESAALVLSLVNGLFLLRFYTRDSARLRVEPVHPDTYQWWFRLPDGEREGIPTRRFGFLLYLAALNSGLRPTTLNSWRLRVRAANLRSAELRSLSIPEPSTEFAGNVKVYRVLGIRGLIFDEGTRLEPGGSTSGMAYYVYECYGDGSWDPMIRNGVIQVKLRAGDVFGRRAACRIACREKPLNEIEKMVPGVSLIK